MSEKIHVQTSTDYFTLHGKPCEISAHSFVPTIRNDPPERTYFNTPIACIQKEKRPGSTFDRLFKFPLSYDNKLHRCDREHAKSRGLNVHDEEKDKVVPSLASSEYGHRLSQPLEERDRDHVRIGHVQSEFFRRNMIP